MDSDKKSLPVHFIRGDPLDTVKKKKKIVSMDGAMGAAVQVRLLKRIEERRPGFLADIDMFAGASDGTIMGLYLAKHLRRYPEEPGRSAEETQRQRDQVDQHNLAVVSKCIQFCDDIARSLTPTLRDYVWFATGLRPLRDGRELHAVIEQYLGETYFCELPHDMLAVALDVSDHRPRTFRNFGYEAKLTAVSQLRIVDIALYSSAVPVLLPVRWARGWPYSEDRKSDAHLFIDGSIVTNNPTMVMITNVISLLAGEGEAGWNWRESPPQYPFLDQLTVLSLGAYQKNDEDGEGELQWGWLRWLLNRKVNLLSILFFGWFQGGNEEVHNQALHLLGSRSYYRCSPEICYLNLLRLLFFGPIEELIHGFDRAVEDFMKDHGDRLDKLVNRGGWLDEAEWGRGETDKTDLIRLASGL